jgi:ABC-type antimicrobial peptide transport system permease subunit
MSSLYDPVGPVIMRLQPDDTSILYARLDPGRTAEGLAGLESVVKQFNAEYPFEYAFLDVDFEAAYRSETVLSALTRIFAAIAIFISCLGLFGLISFSTEQRTKEIGVRKVLGATVPHLMVLLTGEITRLVLLGIVIAVPTGYFVVRSWLSNFTYHMDIGIGMFVLAGIGAVTIAWLTVGYQSFKAARADPARSLRYE